MNKIFKISLKTIGLLLVLFAAFFAYMYYNQVGKFSEDRKKYPNYIGYINPEHSLLNQDKDLCDEGKIYGTHHGLPKIAYHISKKHFKNSILSAYKNQNYNDSGYLNFRFLVNCEGKAGWFEIIEMNLELEKTNLDDNMVNQLLNLTSNSKHWNIFNVDGAPKNYYMYVSYRIEHGEITEILP